MTKKVLVVDDDDKVTMFMSRLLKKKFGCHVSTAFDGLDALLKVKREKPDYMVLDITMPRLDGIETLKAIRQDKRYSDIKVIMLTAVGDRRAVTEIVRLGVSGYIMKPLTFMTAYERIQDIFDRCN